MHGINTRQICNYLPVIATNQDAGQDQRAQCLEHYVDSPLWINELLGTTFDNENQYYIKRLYKELCIVNNSCFPIIAQVYWLRTRNDLFDTATVIMNDDAPNILDSYFTPTTGQNFRKQFKIVKSKHFTMKPATPYRFKLRSAYACKGRPIQGSVEGNTNYVLRKGNTIFFAKFDGMPQMSNSTGVYGTLKSPIILNGYERWYCSYYRMDDVDPDSGGSNTIPPQVGAENTHLNPAMYVPIAANTPAFSNYYTNPQPVTTYAP